MDREQLLNKFGLGITEEILRRCEIPEHVATDGSGENTLILYCFRSDGTEVIQTNCDPVWDTDEEFRELKSEMSPTGI